MRFLHVTHSIPDGMAVAVDTPHGTILHTGDFKIDQTPIDGRPTDLHGLAEEASGRGVHLLLSDSTNAEEPGHTDSERSVGPVLQRDRRATRRRSSSPPASRATSTGSSRSWTPRSPNGRVVAFLGRSMQNSVGAARRLGLSSGSTTAT